MEKVFKDVALPLALKFEGGYVNDPLDHGGATNKGITQKVYDTYRISKGLVLQSVKLISNDEVEAIYYNEYWLKGSCDKLGSSKLSVVHFDTCINAGIKQSSKFIQRAVGAEADGVIGSKTIALVLSKKPDDLVSNYLGQRRAFYQAIVNNNATQAKFLAGWLKRVSQLEVAVAKIV